MPGRGQAKAVVLSLLAHAAVGISLGQASREEPAVTYDFEIEIPEPVPEPVKKEPEPVEDEPEAHETPPEVARSEPRPPPSEAPPASTDEPEPPGPLASGVGMENQPGGDGPAVGPASRPAPARPSPAAARPDTRATAAPRPAEECGEPASKPKPSSRPRDIEYLDDARARDVEGRLVLAVTVTADGSVAGVEVKSPVDPALDAAAVNAVKTWRFEPARRCGKPIEGTFTLARRFVLGD